MNVPGFTHGKPARRCSRRKFRIFPLFAAAALLASAASCFLESSAPAVLWTDRPEFALYTEYFNTSQDSYKVEVRYFESPAQQLTESEEIPDIVAASWLKSNSTRELFRPLDSVFSEDGLSRSSFYPRLLALGTIDNSQYLLPVNFNIPTIIFARDPGQGPSNPFTIEMAEIKEKGKAFNVLNNGVYTKMGISISSDDDFLFLASVLLGAGFREASPVAWDSPALEQAAVWLQSWITEANTSIRAEEDFTFKYLYDPPDKLVNSGRILYMYMNSHRFFALPEERRANLDFRWIAEKEMIPLNDANVYYGIHKKAKARKAAEAYTRWFFSPETQRQLLEAGKSIRLNETSFGIAGGFSAMKNVTEQIFPQFYPDLLGHIPPESSLSPPNILPRNWLTIKERVILPYLHERIRRAGRDEIRPLERRVSEWYRLNN